MVFRKIKRGRKRLQKYVVVGGKKAGKKGRILSTHRNYKNAKQSASKFFLKGYHGAVWQRTKREKAGARLSFAKKGKEHWLGKMTF